MVTRPAIFKWRQSEPALILCAVRWYLRRAVSTLNHANIVTLHDIARDSGVDFLVMEYVEGKSI
jgi:serine/threonine protein kinase